jgi:hypothetical protein
MLICLNYCWRKFEKILAKVNLKATNDSNGYSERKKSPLADALGLFLIEYNEFEKQTTN